MSFSSLGLNKFLLQAIEESGYTKPRPVQAKAIPPILAGQDVIASAQTGTGKTAAFVLPLLHRLAEHPGAGRGIRALVLTPTRELAAQVADNLAAYGKHLTITSCVVVGGVKIGPQISRLKKSCDVVIATPGRFLDLLNQGVCHLSSLEILVLDEADRMLDMGFIRDIRKILALMPAKRQSLLFSATFSNDIKALAKTFLNKPVNVEVAARNATADRVTQVVHPVDKDKKRSLLSYKIGSENWKQVLVFTRTKHGANRLVKQLIEDGLTAVAIHGNKSQGARTKALASFKRGDVRVLVATDIAARGIDIDALPYVVNYELPNVPEDYVHRIGRTGRSDYAGLAVSLVCVDELPFLKDIEKLLKCRLTQEVVPGYEVDTRIKAEPIILGGQKRSRPARGSSQSRNRRSSSDGGSGSRHRSASGQGSRSHGSSDHRSDAEGRSASGQGPRSHGSSDRRSDGEGRSDDRRRSGSGQGPRSRASSDHRSDGEGNYGDRRRSGSGQGPRSRASSDHRSDGEGNYGDRRRSGSGQGPRSRASSDHRSDGEGNYGDRRRSASGQGPRSRASSDHRSDGEGNYGDRRRSGSGQGPRSRASSDHRSDGEGNYGDRRRSGSGQGPRSRASSDHRSDGEGNYGDRRRSGSGQGPRSRASSDHRSDGEGNYGDRRRSGSGQGPRSRASSDRRSEGEGRSGDRRRSSSAQGPRSHGSSDRRSGTESGGNRRRSASGQRSSGATRTRSH